MQGLWRRSARDCLLNLNAYQFSLDSADRLVNVSAPITLMLANNRTVEVSVRPVLGRIGAIVGFVAFRRYAQ